jgi:CheY-like chemotaxis protein
LTQARQSSSLNIVIKLHFVSGSRMSTLLLIDDDLAVLEVFSRVFRDSDVLVLGATSAAEGLTQVEAAEPDMVVLDVMLPDASGLETLQRFKPTMGACRSWSSRPATTATRPSRP